jgi:hypothetical protein
MSQACVQIRLYTHCRTTCAVHANYPLNHASRACSRTRRFTYHARGSQMPRVQITLQRLQIKIMLEEVDIRMAEAKKDTLDFKRDIIVAAENPKTGATQADKFVKCARACAAQSDLPGSASCRAWRTGGAMLGRLRLPLHDSL